MLTQNDIEEIGRRQMILADLASGRRFASYGTTRELSIASAADIHRLLVEVERLHELVESYVFTGMTFEQFVKGALGDETYRKLIVQPSALPALERK